MWSGVVMFVQFRTLFNCWQEAVEIDGMPIGCHLRRVTEYDCFVYHSRNLTAIFGLLAVLISIQKAEM